VWTNYKREASKVIYKSENGNDAREFDSIILLQAYALISPIKMSRWLRYMGYYSNVCRGKRKRQNIDGADFIIADDPDD
jgi:hypothetical protein